MRRNFAEVLKAGKIDIENEYGKLYNLFYGKDNRDNTSIAEIVSNHFINFKFRGTCLTLEEFNRTHGFNFNTESRVRDEEHFICFMEYVYNLIKFLDNRLLFHDRGKFFYLSHIECVAELIGYIPTSVMAR